MDKDNIESIVPLLPMQQSFLWQSLSSEPQDNIIQLRCTLSGQLKPQLLEATWHTIINRYQALRSTVHWQNVPAPIQIVHKQIEPHFVVVDVTRYPSVESYLEHDQHQALILTRPVPYRMALYPNNDASFDVIWSMSHVLLDGWSSTIVINDWIHLYTDKLKNKPIVAKRVSPLSDHARWIKQQDIAQLTCYWDAYLPNTFNTHPLPFQTNDAPHQRKRSNGTANKSISPLEFSSIKRDLKSAGISLNTLLQVAFATVLQTRSSSDPVVFTTTASGRHVDIDQVQNRVGMMINMMPIRVDFDPEITIEDWLRQQQTSFFKSLPYAHASAQQIAALRPENAERHRCLLVIENQPAVMSTPAVTISNYRSAIVSEFDLTLSVIPGDSLVLVLNYHPDKFTTERVEERLAALVDLLSVLPTSLTKRASSLDSYKTVDRYTISADTQTVTAIADQEGQTHAHVENLSDQRKQNAESRAGESRTLLLHELHGIWCNVLNRQDIDVNQSFFDLGGTSLQAIMMFEQIEKLLMLRLPATTLFTAPSLQQLAEFIESTKPEHVASAVVVANAGGSNVPLFIPFEQADMLMYQPLLAELGEDQPVYGLQIPLGEYPSEETLQNLTKNIAAIHPSGPYRLAGVSGAGLVAWDLAQRLTEDNRKVDLLALLDSYGPQYPQLQPPVIRLATVGLSTVKLLATLGVSGIRKLGNTVRMKPVGESWASTDISEMTRERSSRFSEEFQRQTNQEKSKAFEFVREVSEDASPFVRAINELVLRLSAWTFRSAKLRMEFIVFTQGLLLEHRQSLSRFSSVDAPASISGTSLDTSSNDSTNATSISSIGEKISSRDDTKDASRDNNQNSSSGEPVLRPLPCTCGSSDHPITQLMLNRFTSMYQNLKPYKGNILYCRAMQRPAGIVDDPLAGWDNYMTGTYRVCAVPGDHTSILKPPNVRVMADAIKSETAKADNL